MANTSISGLASGLDTATIIDQLMSLEARTQTGLKTKLTTQQGTLKTLQDLNAKIAALGTQSKDLSVQAAFSPLKATASGTGVTATAGTGVTSGSFEVQVVATASAHRLTFGSSAAPTTHVTGATNDVVLGVGGVPVQLSTDGTLSGLVSALNGASTGVRASTVTLDDGTRRLVVQSATTGAAGSFTLTASDGSQLLGGATVSAGRDAAITLGPDTLHSPTNTFADVLSGVSLTVTAAAVGTTVSVDVSADTSAVQAKVKTLVDAVNAALTTIDSLTATGGGTGAAGPLAGDSTVGALRSRLLGAVYPQDGTSLAAMGLQTDRTGKLVLDTAKFASAYAADPGKVAAAFGPGGTGGTSPGFAQRVSAVADRASNTYTGSLSTAVSGSSSSIKRLKDSIDDWDSRLTLRRATLTQQFTALETALSKMSSQSSWLSGQVSSLSSGS